MDESDRSRDFAPRAPCVVCGRPALIVLRDGRSVCGQHFTRDGSASPLSGVKGGEQQPSSAKPE